MENIIEPSLDFDFSKLSLAHPTALNGGAYFTKILYNKEPIYIQTHKSKTKQGIVKNGKKYYCDLVFDNSSEQTINWFEKLEERCQQLLFEKSNDWFEGTLDKNDIDNAFNSILKIYKSGKFYLLKTNIKNLQSGDAPAVKVYNENESVLSYNNINIDTEIISILEIQGIKFTTRSFQIEISLKQIMVLDNEPLFENCIIKATKNTNKISTTTSKTSDNNPLEEKDIIHENRNLVEIQNLVEDEKENVQHDTQLEEVFIPMMTTNNVVDKITEPDNLKNINSQIINISSEVDNILPSDRDVKLDTNVVKLDNNVVKLDSNVVKLDSNVDLNIDIEELPNSMEDDNLTELDIQTNIHSEEPLQLKKPNQIYLDLYREARSKAKIAKKNAILAYLEAKNIKKTFMIENINDSDSDFDDEIDEVSESELENL